MLDSPAHWCEVFPRSPALGLVQDFPMLAVAFGEVCLPARATARFATRFTTAFGLLNFALGP